MKSHEDEAVIKRQGISPGLFFFFLSFVFFVVVVAICGIGGSQARG